MNSENQKSIGGMAKLAKLASSTLEAAKKEHVPKIIDCLRTPTTANLAKIEKSLANVRNDGLEKAHVEKKVLSDMDWLLAIVDSIAQTTIENASGIASIVAANDIPWPGGMAEPDTPNMAVGKIMGRLFNGLDETLDKGSMWMVSEIQIDAKCWVRRCKEKCCNKNQEWYTKIWYCIDDEDKPSEF